MYDFAARTREIVTEEVPIIRCETERAAQHDLHAVLRLIDTGAVRASEKTRRVTGAGAKAITEILYGGDFYQSVQPPDDDATDPGPIKAFAWPLLLQSAGFVDLSGTKLQLTPTGKKALTSPLHEALRTVWRRWLKATLLDEFNRIDAVKGQTGQGKRGMTEVTGRRAAIVSALSACPPNQWIAFDEFSRFMVASGNTFEVTRDAWTLYVAEPQYGAPGYEGFGDWPILQGRYLMAFLFEYAATIGLIDVAFIHPSDARSDYGDLWGTDDLDCFSRYDGLQFIRINALGAWCLGLAQKYVPSSREVSQVLKVLPTLEVVAIESLLPGDALVLEQFAERTADRVWKIQSIKMLKALEDGHSVAEMEAFLRAQNGGSLPHTVEVFFKDMAERAACLVDRGPARVIEAADAMLAQLLVNDARLRSLCLLAGERSIVVPAASETTFRRVLRELGYGLPTPQGGKV